MLFRTYVLLFSITLSIVTLAQENRFSVIGQVFNSLTKKPLEKLQCTIAKIKFRNYHR